MNAIRNEADVLLYIVTEVRLLQDALAKHGNLRYLLSLQPKNLLVQLEVEQGVDVLMLRIQHLLQRINLMSKEMCRAGYVPSTPSRCVVALAHGGGESAEAVSRDDAERVRMIAEESGFYTVLHAISVDVANVLGLVASLGAAPACWGEMLEDRVYAQSVLRDDIFERIAAICRMVEAAKKYYEEDAAHRAATAQTAA